MGKKGKVRRINMKLGKVRVGGRKVRQVGKQDRKGKVR